MAGIEGFILAHGRACAAPHVETSRGHGARADLIIDAPQYHEVPATSTSAQIVRRRHAAPVPVLAPSKTKASEPSLRLQYSRRLVKVGLDVLLQGHVARVVLRRAYGPP